MHLSARREHEYRTSEGHGKRGTPFSFFFLPSRLYARLPDRLSLGWCGRQMIDRCRCFGAVA